MDGATTWQTKRQSGGANGATMWWMERRNNGAVRVGDKEGSSPGGGTEMESGLRERAGVVCCQLVCHSASRFVGRQKKLTA
jgi:hypothetical protein